MSVPPMTGGGGSTGGSGRSRQRDITARFIKFGLQLVYEPANQGLKQLSSNWKKLIDMFKKSGSGIREADKGLEGLASQINKTKKASGTGLTDVKKEILEVGGAGDVASGAFKIFRGELARTGSMVQASISAFDHLIDGMDKIHSNIKKNLPEGLKMVKGDLTAMVDLLTKFRGQLVISGAILGPWTYLAKQASNLYDTFADIFTLITFNRNTLQDMAQSFGRAAAGMFASAEEIRATTDAAIQIGIRGSKSLQDFSVQAYKMGRVLGLADSEAVNLLRNFQMMRFSQDDIDKTTVAMRLLQERTGITSREMAGVVEQSSLLSKQFAPGNRQGFTEGLLKMASQFKIAKMDVTEGVDKMGKFLDVSNKGASKFAAILAGRMGMSVAEFRKQIKDGTLKMEDMSDAAQYLMDQFGQYPGMLDRITGGYATWISQMANAKKVMGEQQKALDDLAADIGINRKTTDSYFKNYLKATDSLSVSWGRLKTVLGYLVAAMGAPIFYRLAKVLDGVAWAGGKVLYVFGKIQNLFSKQPEWLKSVEIWSVLAVGMSSFAVIVVTVIGAVVRLLGSLAGLSSVAKIATSALKVMLSPFYVIRKVFDIILKLLGGVIKGFGEFSSTGSKVGGAMEGMLGPASKLLGFLGKMLGVVGALISAWELWDNIRNGFKDDKGTTVGEGLSTAFKYGVMGAGIGSLGGLPGMAIGGAVGLAFGGGVSMYRGLQDSSLQAPSLNDFRGLLPLQTPTMDQGGPVGELTSGASDVPATMQRPRSPMQRISQSEVVNAIGDQTRALLLALKELGSVISQPSALEMARARFGGNTDVFDRVAGLEVR
jgi:hypothetical protein